MASRTVRRVILLGIVVLIPALMLQTNLGNTQRVSIAGEWMIRATSGFESVTSWIAQGFEGWFERASTAYNATWNNQQLRKENAELHEQLRNFDQLAAENKRLKDLLGLKQNYGTAAVTARVIARDITPSFRVVRIALDTSDTTSVQVGMPVITPEGLVGQIGRISGEFSDVLLSVDSGSHVDVVVGKQEVRGRLEGLGIRARYRCRLQYDLDRDPVAVGDEVRTSGLGSKFPEGILVGKIVKVDSRNYGLYQVAEVAPSVDFTRLREVLILLTSMRADDVMKRPDA